MRKIALAVAIACLSMTTCSKKTPNRKPVEIKPSVAFIELKRRIDSASIQAEINMMSAYARIETLQHNVNRVYIVNPYDGSKYTQK